METGVRLDIELKPDRTRPAAARPSAGPLAPPPAGLVILPGDPPEWCPELLTESEAIRYLRLDLIDITEPAETLRRYRREAKLRGTQVGKCVRYLRSELDSFLRRQTEENPR